MAASDFTVISELERQRMIEAFNTLAAEVEAAIADGLMKPSVLQDLIDMYAILGVNYEERFE